MGANVRLGDVVKAGVVKAMEVRQRLLAAGFDDPETAPWPSILCCPCAHGIPQRRLTNAEIEWASRISKGCA